MKKLFLFLVGFLLLINFVAAADIAYVVKFDSQAQKYAGITDAIIDLGYSYDLIDDSDVGSTDFEDYQMILLSDENIDGVPVNDYKSLIVNHYYYDGWSGSLGSTGSNHILDAYVSDSDSPITQGVDEWFDVYTSCCYNGGGTSIPLYYLGGQKFDTQSVVTTGDSIGELGEFVIATKETPRRVFFGAVEYDYWTEDSETLFKNSVTWILEDNDADGVANNEDNCIDVANPLQEDFDEDGFGDVCDDDIDDDGVLNEDDDCDYTPEGTEIDELGCDLYPDDLIAPVVELISPEDGSFFEVDEITFNYIVTDDMAGVLECDFYANFDGEFVEWASEFVNNGEVNDFFASDIESGVYTWNVECSDGTNEAFAVANWEFEIDVPDAPSFFEMIELVEADEGELIEFTINAIDPDGDDLEFDVDGLPDGAEFVDNEDNTGTFSWQTDYDDSGEYEVEFIVSDGVFEDNAIVEIIINNANQAPVLIEDIEDTSWDEDDSSWILLSYYFEDLDGDNLDYQVDGNMNIDIDFDGDVAELNPDADWNGDEEIVFTVCDEEFCVDSNVVVLTVLPINDAPVLETIPELYVDEGEEVGIDLIVSDVDNEEIDFVYSLNEDYPNVEFEFYEADGDESDLPWFKWETGHDSSGYYEVEVIVEDGVGGIDSQIVIINVNNQNQPPVIEDLDDVQIEEDSGFQIIIEDLRTYAYDTDGTIDRFEIVEEDSEKVDCIINDFVFAVEPAQDFDDESRCVIRVYDNEGDYDETTFDIELTGTNDAPVIVDYFPKGVVRLMENTDETFWVEITDVDGDAEFSWFLDDVEVGDEQDYIFNEELGDYELEVFVSDLESSVSHSWGVFVGDISDFTCEEVGGYVFGENEICLGDILDVADIENCCSIQGSEKPPEFGDVDVCEVIEEGIEISFKEPDSDDEFGPGDVIEVELRIGNELDEDLDFDVEVYLYDLTRDEEIENDDRSLDVDEGDREKIDFEFEVSDDVEDGNDYAIFVKVDSNGYCNQDYMWIDIDREKHDVVVNDIKIDPANIACGDMIYVEIEIKNHGTGDEDVYIVIENAELGIYEEGTEFEIEKYSEDDTETRSFDIRIPENVDEGEYDIKATVFYDNGDEEDSKSINFVLENCRIKEEEIVDDDRIQLNQRKQIAPVVESSGFIENVLVGVSELGVSRRGFIIIDIALVFLIVTIFIVIVSRSVRR